MERRGQLSAEMLIVLVVILGLVVLLASVMLKSANKAADNIEQKTDSVLGMSNFTFGNPGDPCKIDDDCKSKSCSAYSDTCN